MTSFQGKQRALLYWFPPVDTETEAEDEEEAEAKFEPDFTDFWLDWLIEDGGTWLFYPQQQPHKGHH